MTMNPLAKQLTAGKHTWTDWAAIAQQHHTPSLFGLRRDKKKDLESPLEFDLWLQVHSMLDDSKTVICSHQEFILILYI